jgi:hypothetical protein
MLILYVPLLFYYRGVSGFIKLGWASSNVISNAAQRKKVGGGRQLPPPPSLTYAPVLLSTVSNVHM